MGNDESVKSNKILAGNNLKMILPSDDLKMVRGLTRRDFVKYAAGTFACIYLGTLNTGCTSGSGSGASSGRIAGWPIDSNVVTTTTRVLSFSVPAQPAGPNSGTGLYLTELHLIDQYGKYDYGDWQYSAEGLPIKQRFDLMPDPDGYAASVSSLSRIKQFTKFFTISDIHITDKEAPNQLIYLQQLDAKNCGTNTSIYSPVMVCTTQVLDAAIQTINALHKKSPFNFGISLGDTCNNTSYNELRWYIDVIDGKVITPSSGANLGADSIDYQKPFQAAGLDKSISWYQALGNHDHFYIGSFPIDADPAIGLRNSYLSDTVWEAPDVLVPNPHPFPVLFEMEDFKNKTPKYYQGILDGLSRTGRIIYTGTLDTPPVVAADPNRRSLLRTEWIQEYFNTSTNPVGHGFNLVDPSQPSGFACYSFLPNPDIPLKVIVLDDTQSETDGSTDIHGHGFLDANRLKWLKGELVAGQTANQLMIIAAHVPIGVSSIGSETEWWESNKDAKATEMNAVNLTELVAELKSASNLLMWVAGHRHLNTVKAFVFDDRVTAPEKGFWQVETSSLRDHPQQLRTFEIYLNSDYTVSIVTVNVDPAAAEGTPAWTSRYYSIATQQIIQTDLNDNNKNVEKEGTIPVETMDPSRPQDGKTDKSIVYGTVPGVHYCASYNAELFKQLSTKMITALKAQFPT